jgi:hypothetical protein
MGIVLLRYQVSILYLKKSKLIILKRLSKILKGQLNKTKMRTMVFEFVGNGYGQCTSRLMHMKYKRHMEQCY